MNISFEFLKKKLVWILEQACLNIQCRIEKEVMHKWNKLEGVWLFLKKPYWKSHIYASYISFQFKHIHVMYFNFKNAIDFSL